VREAIFGKLGLPLRDVGEESLKNIARPVHVYEIQPPDAPAQRDWFGANTGSVGAARMGRQLPLINMKARGPRTLPLLCNRR
jgi:hypothetical protein